MFLYLIFINFHLRLISVKEDCLKISNIPNVAQIHEVIFLEKYPNIYLLIAFLLQCELCSRESYHLVMQFVIPNIIINNSWQVSHATQKMGNWNLTHKKNTSLSLIISGWILHENKNLKVFRMHKREILWVLIFKKLKTFIFACARMELFFPFSVKNYKVCCKFAFTLK